MADEKISAMPSATTLAGTELIAGVQSGVNVSVTPAQIKTYVGAGNGTGTVSSVNVVSPLVGGNITTAGNVALPTATDGQLLIGNTTSGLLQVGSIVAGSNVTITPGHGNITISSTASGNTTGTPGGTSGQVQYNNAGSFAGITEGAVGSVLVGQGNATAPVFKSAASVQATIAAPTGPGSTTVYQMQGFGGSPGNAIITPTKTGNIFITISGDTSNGSLTASGDGMAWQISHGSGAAPANGAALTGTQDGSIQNVIAGGTVGANIFTNPFSISAIVTGLALGTAIWIDLAAEATVATGYNFKRVTVAAFEF